MTVNTKAYGAQDVDDRQKLTFPRGIYGFENLREFVLMDAHQRPFYWLQSTEVQDVAFVLISPDIVRPDYAPTLNPTDLKELDLDADNEKSNFVSSL